MTSAQPHVAAQSVAPTIPLENVFGDAAQVERLRRGDPEAFETLVRTHSGRMLSVARRLLGNEQNAQDAVQEASIRAYRAIGGFESRAQLQTWLHRIVVNSALMMLRERRRKPEESIEDLLPTFQADGHQTAESREWATPCSSARNLRASSARPSTACPHRIAWFSCCVTSRSATRWRRRGSWTRRPTS